jgi:hypothetical protein
MAILRRILGIIVRGCLWVFYLFDGFVILELTLRFTFLGTHGVKGWLLHITPHYTTDGIWKLPSLSQAYNNFFKLCLTQLIGTACFFILDRLLWRAMKNRNFRAANGHGS